MARSRNPVDRVFEAIVPRAVDAIDPDELIERLDLDRLLARTDLDAVLARLDLDALLARLDVDALIARLDVDALIQRVDVDGLVQRVDVDGLVQRVDVDGLVQRVDVDGLVQRVDIDRLIGRVDLDAVLSGVDIRGIVSRAGIDQAIAETATGLAGRTLDLVRRRVHRLDALVLAAIDRILGRSRRGSDAPVDGAAVPAGPLARTLAFLTDTVVVSTSFSLLLLLATTLAGLFTGRRFDVADDGGWGWAVGFWAWWLLYLWASVGLGGRTVGKGLLGVSVVAVDGSAATSRKAFARAIAFPFSFVLGLGFLPAVVGRRRRALHDLVGGTQVAVDASSGPSDPSDPSDPSGQSDQTSGM